MRPVALLAALVACKTETTDVPPCEGGGDPAVEVGDGGADGFAAWGDGDAVPITFTDRYGFRMDLTAAGLDTTSAMTLLVRVTLDGETQSTDAAATLTFLCEGEGPGWAGLFVPLGDAQQTEAEAAALDGTSFSLSASVVDAAGDTGTDEGTFRFSF